MRHCQNAVDEECLVTEFGSEDRDRTVCQNALMGYLFSTPRAQEPDS